MQSLHETADHADRSRRVPDVPLKRALHNQKTLKKSKQGFSRHYIEKLDNLKTQIQRNTGMLLIVYLVLVTIEIVTR